MEKKKIKVTIEVTSQTVREYLKTNGGGLDTYTYDDVPYFWKKKPNKSKHIRLK